MAHLRCSSVTFAVLGLVLGCGSGGEETARSPSPEAADETAPRAESLAPPAGVVHAASRFAGGVVPGQIVVKYRETVEGCAHCVARSGQAFRAHTRDRSGSLDALHAALEVRSVEPVFRGETEEQALRTDLGLDVLPIAALEQKAA